jgi:enoyl-CoA hydratase
MAFLHLEEEDRNGVTVLRLCRPPANAIDLELARELAAAAEALAIPGRRRAAVLIGTGACFSGGVDVKRIPTYDAGQRREMVRAINRLVAGLYACPVPLVAAINGHAIGGGLIIPVCADYRVCVAGAVKLGVTEARAGIPFPAAPLAVLRAELPPSTVRLLSLRSVPVDPEAARALGVVDEIVPAERLLERAIEVAEELASGPSEGYRRVKAQIRADGILKTRAAAEGDDDPMLEGWLEA